MILRKLVTNNWVHVSPGLVLGKWGAVEIHEPFGGISVGRSSMKKLGDHQNKKLFINQSVKVLIPLK